jgi:hypothetical protein
MNITTGWAKLKQSADSLLQFRYNLRDNEENEWNKAPQTRHPVERDVQDECVRGGCYINCSNSFRMATHESHAEEVSCEAAEMTSRVRK